MAARTRKERLVELTADLPESTAFPVFTCNYCAGEGKEVKSVVALEFQGEHTHRFYGMCGNHAEVSGVSQEWQDRK